MSPTFTRANFSSKELELISEALGLNSMISSPVEISSKGELSSPLFKR